MRLHWSFWIKKFGAPAFYSTMHWESKHKQLKLIKERQTNNTNHCKDVSIREVQKTTRFLFHLKQLEIQVFIVFIIVK